MIPELVNSLLPFFDKKQQQRSNSLPGLDGTEKVDFILSDFNSALDFEYENLERDQEAWRLYSGIDDSQYSVADKKALLDQNRNPFQGNFIRQKVDGLAGSIIKNFFDIGYESNSGEYSDLTKLAKELLLIDKELLDWNSQYNQLVVDGLVNLGVEQMYIDFRYSPFGNIGFKRIEPGHLILDPRWTTNNSWDLKRAYKVAFLTAEQIKEIYKSKSEELDYYIKLRKGMAGDYDNGDDDFGTLHHGLSERYGDKYRVIEYHHMEKEKRTVKVSISDGVVLPDATDEYLQEWAILNGVDLSDGVITREEVIDVYYVTTICPGISRYLILEDKRGLIQIGRLPFFPWSSGRINGKNSGIPELLKSLQRTYNFRESMLDYMIGTSAVGGILIDPDIVDGDENKMRLLKDSWNKPGFREYSSPGAISSGRQHFQELPRTQMDYGIVNEINRMLDMSDRISKQPPVLDGRSEGSEETGILFGRKQAQAEIAQALLVKSLEQHWNEKGEAYLLCAKILYSGVYREMYTFGEGKKIELNKPIVTPAGEIIENDISQLPRMKVVVTQSPQGTTSRAIDRAINTELLRVLGADNPINRSIAVKNVMRTLDISKTERAKYEEAAELEYQLASENIRTNLLNLKMTQAQIMQQMQMLAGGGMPQPGAEGQPSQQQGDGQPPQQGGPPQPRGNPSQEMEGQNAVIASQEGVK